MVFRTNGSWGGALFLLLCTFVFLFLPTTSLQARNTPSIYDIRLLDAIRHAPGDYPLLKIFLSQADSIVKLKPLSVVDDNQTFTPNNNYYCSIGRYSWPDSNKPDSPWVVRDGISNPEYENYDGVKLV